MSAGRLLAALVIGLALAFSAPVAAHEAATGRHGGLRVDAGNYHTELFLDGSRTVIVFLSDADDKPIPSAGFKATAILIIDGKTERISLEPADGSRLIGMAPMPVSTGAKGVIRLTAPDGTTAQGKL